MYKYIFSVFFLITSCFSAHTFASERYLDPNASMNIFSQTALTNTNARSTKLSTQYLAIWGLSFETNENLSFDIHALLPIGIYGLYGNVRYAKNIAPDLYIAGKFNLGYTDFFLVEDFEDEFEDSFLEFHASTKFFNTGFTPTLTKGNHQKSFSISVPLHFISNLEGEQSYTAIPTLASGIQISPGIKLNFEFLAPMSENSALKSFALAYGARFFGQKSSFFADVDFIAPFGEDAKDFYEADNTFAIGGLFFRLGTRF